MARYLTGFQPTGTLHIGNYFGALRPAIELQEKGEAFYFIADYHALTTIHDAGRLRELVRGVAIDALACGLDPQKACFFRQSDVPVVTELAWILSTVTPMGLLERSHSYKDKLARGIPPSHGLFAYPTLMAADILLYDSDVVPVGKDQKQHLEITRDIAIKFNELYGCVLKLPEPVIREESATVPGLDGQKMSKSYGNTIELFLDEKLLRKKIMSIVTDSAAVDAAKNPDNSTIVALYRLFATEGKLLKMEEDFRAGGCGYGDFKNRLFEVIWNFFAPMRSRRELLLSDPGSVDRILQEGADRARAVAKKTIARVRDAIGIRPLN
ncbi:MAG: tryptophan--tRNA ligase [Acidobacteria bacterium]|nr:MAG: tryptophan--tRNA ligase [Acidobacteriota bacterium]